MSVPRTKHYGKRYDQSSPGNCAKQYASRNAGWRHERTPPEPGAFKKTLIKEPVGNAQLFRLARRDLFLKQEWTLPSSTVSKKVTQRRQTE
ncbi:hypothetical protein KL86DES1_20046 [uncultured Desulfovibrio sp.]|uniref:Uncharacterized protein n=1 Tax=uncultured Desulfovibrio sp. TaxID=167968 RepID=A0A212L1X7_9BACT|nr:hypothetical protein KL86DES1_20046 [uncultured Desulfovibrio sp.]VZH32947.1 conserved protein of unknown function [Desulfovibrio sp. 86]